MNNLSTCQKKVFYNLKCLLTKSCKLLKWLKLEISVGLLAVNKVLHKLFSYRIFKAHKSVVFLHSITEM